MAGMPKTAEVVAEIQAAKAAQEARRRGITPAAEPLSVFESAAVLSLRPGDVVLFRSPTRLSDAARSHIAEMLDEVFPAHESIILEGGQDLAVLRPEPGIVGRMWRRVFERKAMA